MINAINSYKIQYNQYNRNAQSRMVNTSPAFRGNDNKDCFCLSNTKTNKTLPFCSSIPKIPKLILTKTPKSIDDIEYKIITTCKNGWEYMYVIQAKTGEHIGHCEYTDGGAMSANLPDEYKDGQDSVCIDVLFTNGEYKGTGTKIIKNIVKKSKELGHEGRVYLLACSVNVGNPEYKSMSPVPFYFNLGFRFLDEEKNTRIEYEIKQAKKLGEYPENLKRTSGVMYLPEAAIKKLLED